MTDFFDWINEIKEPELKRLISKSFERWDENDDPFAGYNYLSVFCWLQLPFCNEK